MRDQVEGSCQVFIGGGEDNKKNSGRTEREERKPSIGVDVQFAGTVL